MVRRNLHPTIRPQVSLRSRPFERVPEHGLRQLTSLGRTLLKPIRGLVNWAGENREKIQAAIERYDAAHSRAVAALGN